MVWNVVLHLSLSNLQHQHTEMRQSDGTGRDASHNEGGLGVHVRHTAMVVWCYGAMVLRCYGAMVLRCYGAMVLSLGLREVEVVSWHAK